MSDYILATETLTVADVAVGFTALTLAGAASARVLVLSGTIRARVDGVDPTASVGLLFAQGDQFDVQGTLTAFKAIRAAAGATLLQVTYTVPALPAATAIVPAPTHARISRGPTAALTVTIAQAASVSAAFHCDGMVPVALLMPDAWTAAGLALRVCDTPTGTFLPLHYDSSGTATRVQIVEGAVVAVSLAYRFPHLAWVSGVWMQLESVNPATLAAVAQAAARSLVVTFG